MTTPVMQWLDSMKSIWMNKKPDDITSLLSDDLNYYEDPFSPPLTRKQDVLLAWKDILNQNIETLDINLIYESNDRTGVALWTFKEKDKPEHKGIYFIRLNNEGKCFHFRQFWSIKQ